MGIFFQFSNSEDVTDIEELLLKRYNSIDYILQMDINSGLAFIRKAFEKAEDDRLWDRYLVDYARMTTENMMDYNEYKNTLMLSVINKNMPKPTKEENSKMISQKVERIINLTLKGGGNNGV